MTGLQDDFNQAHRAVDRDTTPQTIGELIKLLGFINTNTNGGSPTSFILRFVIRPVTGSSILLFSDLLCLCDEIDL